MIVVEEVGASLQPGLASVLQGQRAEPPLTSSTWVPTLAQSHSVQQTALDGLLETNTLQQASAQCQSCLSDKETENSLDSLDVQSNVLVAIFAYRCSLCYRTGLGENELIRMPAGDTWNWVKMTYNIYMLAVPRSTRIRNKDSVKGSCLKNPTHPESHRALTAGRSVHCTSKTS